MSKALDYVNVLVANEGTENVGYAASDVNTALLTAKIFADECFPIINAAEAPASSDPNLVLKIAEFILNRLRVIETLGSNQPLDLDDEEQVDDEGSLPEDDDPPVEVVSHPV